MLKPIKKALIIILGLVILLIVIFRAFDLYPVILKKFYPDKYSEYVYKYSKEYNVESDWVFALIRQKVISNLILYLIVEQLDLCKLWNKQQKKKLKGWKLEV